jgi:uroporphyrinogen-III decarboxylase
MISKSLFDEFLAPYYRRVVPRIKKMGSIVMVDSDGLMDPMIPWLLEAGLDGVAPLERQAGVDVAELRRKFRGLKMLGAYDKMVMSRGREAMRAEFERILPVMASGGYLPGCDHQTPPGVSLENYRVYLELFREYAARAVNDW